MTKYQINKQIPGNSIARTVEADSYKLADGYFSFYEGSGSSAKRVFTMDAKHVMIIEVEKP